VVFNSLKRHYTDVGDAGLQSSTLKTPTSAQVTSGFAISALVLLNGHGAV